MQALNIKSQTDQVPFARDFPLPAQGELAKPQSLFDDPYHRFDSAFAQAIDRLADLSLEFVSHLLFGRCRRRRRRGLLLEVLLPTPVMRLAPGGDIGLNATTLQAGNIDLTIIAVVERSGLRLPQPLIYRLNRRHGLLVVIGVVGGAGGTD